MEYYKIAIVGSFFVLLLLIPNATALDLVVDQDDYMVTPSINDVKAGDVINVFARMHVMDEPFDDNLTTALLVDGEPRFYTNESFSLSEDGTTGLWYALVLPTGNFTLEVVVDYPDEFPELSEENNRLSIDLYVKPWNVTEDDNNLGDDIREDSPFEYLPFVMIGLIVVVVGLTALAFYMIEKSRKAQQDDDDLRYHRRH